MPSNRTFVMNAGYLNIWGVDEIVAFFRLYSVPLSCELFLRTYGVTSATMDESLPFLLEELVREHGLNQDVSKYIQADWLRISRMRAKHGVTWAQLLDGADDSLGDEAEEEEDFTLEEGTVDWHGDREDNHIKDEKEKEKEKEVHVEGGNPEELCAISISNIADRANHADINTENVNDRDWDDHEMSYNLPITAVNGVSTDMEIPRQHVHTVVFQCAETGVEPPATSIAQAHLATPNAVPLCLPESGAGGDGDSVGSAASGSRVSSPQEHSFASHQEAQDSCFSCDTFCTPLEAESVAMSPNSSDASPVVTHAPVDANSCYSGGNDTLSITLPPTSTTQAVAPTTQSAALRTVAAVSAVSEREEQLRQGGQNDQQEIYLKREEGSSSVVEQQVKRLGQLLQQLALNQQGMMQQLSSLSQHPGLSPRSPGRQQEHEQGTKSDLLQSQQQEQERKERKEDDEDNDEKGEDEEDQYEEDFEVEVRAQNETMGVEEARTQNETKGVEEVRTQNETKGAEQEDQSGPAQDPELTATNATIDSSTPPPPVTRDDTWCISAVITGSAGNAVAVAEAEEAQGLPSAAAAAGITREKEPSQPQPHTIPHPPQDHIRPRTRRPYRRHSPSRIKDTRASQSSRLSDSTTSIIPSTASSSYATTAALAASSSFAAHRVAQNLASAAAQQSASAVEEAAHKKELRMHRVLLVQTGVRGELNISEGLSSGEGMGLIKASTGRTLLTPHSDPAGGSHIGAGGRTHTVPCASSCVMSCSGSDNSVYSCADPLQTAVCSTGSVKPSLQATTAFDSVPATGRSHRLQERPSTVGSHRQQERPSTGVSHRLQERPSTVGSHRQQERPSTVGSHRQQERPSIGGSAKPKPSAASASVSMLISRPSSGRQLEANRSSIVGGPATAGTTARERARARVSRESTALRDTLFHRTPVPPWCATCGSYPGDGGADGKGMMVSAAGCESSLSGGNLFARVVKGPLPSSATWGKPTGGFAGAAGRNNGEGSLRYCDDGLQLFAAGSKETAATAAAMKVARASRECVDQICSSLLGVDQALRILDNYPSPYPSPYHYPGPYPGPRLYHQTLSTALVHSHPASTTAGAGASAGVASPLPSSSFPAATATGLSASPLCWHSFTDAEARRRVLGESKSRASLRAQRQQQKLSLGLGGFGATVGKSSSRSRRYSRGASVLHEGGRTATPRSHSNCNSTGRIVPSGAVDPAAAPDGLIHTQRGLTPHAPTRPMTSNHTGSIRSSSRGSRLRRSTAGGSCCTEVTRRQHEAVDKGGGSSERAVHISPETGAQIEMHSTAPCFFPTATQAAAAVAGGSWTTV